MMQTIVETHRFDARSDERSPDTSSSIREKTRRTLSASHVMGLLKQVQTRHPRVHAITNTVAQTFIANVLLAVGAVPSMTVAPDEIQDFVSQCDALLVNLGTLDADRKRSIPLAVISAHGTGKPWVLDPVFVDASKPRLAFALSLLDQGPHTIHANSAEIAALGAGTDLLQKTQVLAQTGAQDSVEDATSRSVSLNGHPMMARATATGCMGAALIAAFHTVTDDPFEAALAGTVLMGVAGEIACSALKGPGHLHGAIIDALYTLDEAALDARMRVL